MHSIKIFACLSLSLSCFTAALAQSVPIPFRVSNESQSNVVISCSGGGTSSGGQLIRKDAFQTLFFKATGDDQSFGTWSCEITSYPTGQAIGSCNFNLRSSDQEVCLSITRGSSGSPGCSGNLAKINC